MEEGLSDKAKRWSKKGLTGLVFAAGLWVGYDFRDKDSYNIELDLNRALNSIYQKPETYHGAIYRLLDEAQDLMIVANQDGKLKKGYKDPKDLRLIWKKEDQKYYLALLDLKTGLELGLVDVYGYAQAGSYEERRDLVLQEAESRFFRRASEIDRGIEKFFENHRYTFKFLMGLGGD